MPKLSYNRSERKQRKAAHAILDDPTANSTARAEALKTIRRIDERHTSKLKLAQGAEPISPVSQLG